MMKAGEPDRRGRKFHFQCRRCGSLLESTGERCGEEGKCPTCGVVFTIPDYDVRTGAVRMPRDWAGDDQLPTPMHAYGAAGANAPRIVRVSANEVWIECPRCNTRSPVEANNCTSCGLAFTLEGAQLHPSGVTNGYATASLLLGLLSLPSFLCGLGAFAGLAAVILGFVAVGQIRAGRQGDPAPAVAGIACGLAGILLTAAVIWMG